MSKLNYYKKENERLQYRNRDLVIKLVENINR